MSAGEFMVVNSAQDIGMYIHSQKKVSGLCIHIEAAALRDAYAVQALGHEELLERRNDIISFPEMGSLIYKDDENALGGYLKTVVMNFDPRSAIVHMHEDDFYQQLAMRMVNLQTDFSKRSKLAMRNTVQQELMARLRKAKELIDDSYTSGIGVDRIAKEALLSTSHFYRLFKLEYGLSPYQYLLGKKLEGANNVLRLGKENITETALRFGFADTASFSKAYKKHFGLSPTKSLHRNTIHADQYR